MSRSARYSRQRAAFTLIEIIVVVVILAILAAVVVPNVIHRVDDAKNSAAISDIKSFENACDQYKLDVGQYPPNLDALVDKRQAAADEQGKWNGPYLKNQSTIPKDPWGHDYIYKTPGDGGRDYDIYSAGPDGQPGTPDDIQSWNIHGQ